MKNQLLRASLSVALNLAEGAGRRTARDKLRLYNIAFASLRECQTAIRCSSLANKALEKQADGLGALLYRLTKSLNP